MHSVVSNKCPSISHDGFNIVTTKNHVVLADNSAINQGAIVTPHILNKMKCGHEQDDDKYDRHLIPSSSSSLRTQIPSRDPIPDSKYESNNSLVYK